MIKSGGNLGFLTKGTAEERRYAKFFGYFQNAQMAGNHIFRNIDNYYLCVLCAFAVNKI